MAEFEEKLNAILSDPEAMARIAQMAGAFAGGEKSEARVEKAESGDDPLSAFAALDPDLLSRVLPIVRELGAPQDSDARRLLLALRPYLKEERREKVERALQLARLFVVGRKLLPRGDGHV